ncbi:nucleotide exchange factor GrpE [Actinosynnema pretiosum subsp. pretiosum]|uniref:Nucleotide exchange factor GrpE n=1 Tax=Actinosynnema pretiosum subsp. pretiosum TaxID=103721 RepID=A0AA45L5P7_9PSEU|nr:Heat shock protein GrpE [Actinosynnema pretiosum subsp. pretiosum]QUF03861.1 nucleotide exchange factor GrpE [Actinosynnema pretiosum subsp. pretiosum]
MEEEIAEALAGINSELTGLHAQSKFLNEALDRLHTENDRLRNAEAQRGLQPVLRELVKLADDWRSRRAALDGEDGAAPLRLCDEIVEDVTLLLERQGVDEFHAEVGAAFDRREQQSVGVLPTDAPDLDGTIAEVRRPGYLLGAKVVRFAQVVVFKLTPPPAP